MNIPTEGYIYIMINASLAKNTVKIGYTTRDPEIRARELSKETGLPSDFAVAYDRSVKDCMLAEKLIHEELKNYRTTKTRNDRNREFFKIPLKKAIPIVDRIVKKIDEEFNKHDIRQRKSLEQFLKETGQTGTGKEKAFISSLQAKTLPANTNVSYGSHFYQHKQYPGIVVARKKIITNFINDQGEKVDPKNWHSSVETNKKFCKDNETKVDIHNKSNLGPDRINEIYNRYFGDSNKKKKDKFEFGLIHWLVIICGILLILVSFYLKK